MLCWINWEIQTKKKVEWTFLEHCATLFFLHSQVYFSTEIPWCWQNYAYFTMAPHSSTLAWKIPRAEEPGRLQSMESLRFRQDWATSLSLFTFMHWRRKWQPTRALAWRIPGTAEPGGLPSLGSHRVGHDWRDLAAAAAAAAAAAIYNDIFNSTCK